MNDFFNSRARRLLLSGAVTALVAAATASPALAGNKFPAGAPASTAALDSMSTADCTMPALTEPFSAYNDTNEYALVPGQAFDSFAGTGWTLSGGATIQTATLADEATGSVLDLRSDAEAISPPMCVQSDYTNARTIIRDVSGSQAVKLDAQYAGTSSPVSAGRFWGSGARWTASNPVNTNPGSQSGWQLVVFTLRGSREAGDEQVYNFYVDPRMIS
ncbi:MAG: hypothetical protein ACLP0J_18805 [Solirubrobacteraceae bacterium]